MTTTPIPDDDWSTWLQHRRHADDPEYQKLVRATIESYADRVIAGAQVQPGMTLLDVGTGDGLIPFKVLGQHGSALKVILSDVSAPMLEHVRSEARQRGVEQQCEFVECSAEQLTGIPDQSVDVLTTRAVLAYVSDKPKALKEFHRVLKPGGRLSIGEPIFQDDANETVALRQAVEADPHSQTNRFFRLMHLWKSAQFPDSLEKLIQNPLTNFSERDLLKLVYAAGFVEVRLAFHIELIPSIITKWDVFLNCSPHPWAPALRQIMAQHFTSEDEQLFEQVLRPIVENRQLLSSERIAYINAIKPGPAAR